MKISLPGVQSVTEVELEVSKVSSESPVSVTQSLSSRSLQEDIHLSVGVQYGLTVQLPAAVNEDMSKATFNSKTSSLSIIIPCL